MNRVYVYQEKLENTKRVMRGHTSKDRQYKNDRLTIEQLDLQ
jgi:hypothetical protein